MQKVGCRHIIANKFALEYFNLRNQLTLFTVSSPHCYIISTISTVSYSFVDFFRFPFFLLAVKNLAARHAN